MNDYIDGVIMPFGKYKCEQLLDVLEWIYDNLELNGDLEKSVSDAIDILRAEKNRRGF